MIMTLFLSILRDVCMALLLLAGDEHDSATRQLPTVDDGGSAPKLPNGPAAVKSQDHVRGTRQRNIYLKSK